MMPKRKKPPTSHEPRDTEEVFDRWLGRQLAQAYEEVLNEEVPEDLKRLVRAFKEKEVGGETRKSTTERRPADDPSDAPGPESSEQDGAE